MTAGAPMRLLFASGVSVGGAPRSTVALARLLRERGHEPRVFLGDRTSAPGWYQLGVRAAVKLERTPVRGPLTAVLRRVGRRASVEERDGMPVTLAPLTVNACRAVLRHRPPDVVVANSLPRIEMRWLREDAAAAGIPFVLYVRESHAPTHITVTGLAPDLTISNAESYAEEIRRFAPCAVVPSVLDLSSVTIDSTRRTVLFVNPDPANRPELVLELADLRPEREFVIQESWPLEPDDRQRLVAECDRRANVELRARTDDAASIYRDARVLLATYPSGRPRVVAEAQHNGIPVLALDHPSLREAVGPGGVVVRRDASGRELAAALDALWEEPAYAAHVAEATAHAHRADIDPERVVDRFETLLEGLVDGG